MAMSCTAFCTADLKSHPIVSGRGTHGSIGELWCNLDARTRAGTCSAPSGTLSIHYPIRILIKQYVSSLLKLYPEMDIHV